LRSDYSRNTTPPRAAIGIPITRSGIIVRANPQTVMATPPTMMILDSIRLGDILMVFCSLVEDSSFLLKIECSPLGYIRFLVLKIKKSLLHFSV
jgi:hypothetical protein